VRLALVQRIGLSQLIERRTQSLTISLGKPPLGSQLIIEVIDLLLPRCPAMWPAAVVAKGTRSDVNEGPPRYRRATALAHSEHRRTANLTKSVDLLRVW
jgi:hypothetical protein